MTRRCARIASCIGFMSHTRFARIMNKKTLRVMKTNINDNAKSSATQKDKILEHLMSGKPITPLEALNLYGSLRLGARIADIRKEGYIVYREMVTDAKTGKRYAQYSM